MKKFSYMEPGRLALDSEDAVFTVEFYDTIQELPMRRLNEFNIHLSQDSGIGSTLADFDTRMDALTTALSSGSIDNAIREHFNSRLGLFLMLEHVSTKARALADVVYSINGQSVASKTESEMMEVHHQLAKWMSQLQASEVVEGLKKKFNRELKVGFPELFPDAEEIEFYVKLIKRARLQIDAAVNDADVSIALQEVDSWLAEQMTPANFDFNDTDNAVEKKRREFAMIVAGLAMRNIQNAGELSVYQFHAAIQEVKNQSPKTPS